MEFKRIFRKAVIIQIALGIWLVGPMVNGQELSEGAEILSVELLPGDTPTNFTLRIICSKRVDFTTFWVGGRTFILDLHNVQATYSSSVIEVDAVTAVGAVRISQFMENPVPVARVELDVTIELGSTTQRIGKLLQVAFGPPGPTLPAAGQWRPPPVTLEGAQPPPTTAQAVPRRTGRRNPFDPILKPKEEVDRTNTLIRPLPDAEQLVLTGIIYDVNKPDGTVALLRDAQGATYRLSRGDRVLFGFVRRITANEVVFSLDIYGRRKEVTLTLENHRER